MKLIFELEIFSSLFRWQSSSLVDWHRRNCQGIYWPSKACDLSRVWWPKLSL